MPKDKIGNELKEKDLVQATYTSQANPAHSVELVGRIVKIAEGGIVTPHGQNLGKHPENVVVTPGIISVVVQFDVAYHPQQPNVSNIAKLVEPETSERKSGLLKM